jgi:hypothetical protein
VQGNRFTVQGTTCLCSAQAHNITDMWWWRAGKPVYSTGYYMFLFCAGAQYHRRGGGVQGNRFTVQGITCFCSAQAHNITDVVVACRETGLEWFEQLLQTLFKPKEDKDDATKACGRIKKRHFFLILLCVNLV